MNVKLIPALATLVVAVASAFAMTGAMAVEATQYNPAQGTKARAEVKAEPRSAGVVHHGDATIFIDQPSTLSRAVARNANSDSDVQVVRVGDATQFVDRPGLRSRAEVRAETLAALSTARAKRQ